MKYFKVLWKDDNGLYSAYASTSAKYCVEYKENEWAYPKVPDTKLFIFESFDQACKYIDDCLWGNVIYECEILGEPEKIDFMVGHFDLFDQFWTHKKGQSPARNGSLLVDAIKITNEVKRMTNQNITDCINELIANKDTFSAWNITQKLRAKGYWAEHDRVRQYVHDHMKNSTEYTYTDNGRYLEYSPLDTQQNTSTKTCKINPKPSTQNTQSPITSFQTAAKSRNRITIPADVVRKLNLKHGHLVYFDGKKVSKNFSAGQKSYTVDIYNEIRVPVKQTGIVTVNVYTDHLEIV